MGLRSGTMASGRVATCVLVLFLWPLAVWHVPGADRTFVSFITTCDSRNHLRQISPVVRRVRERFEGKKQVEARRSQVRHKRGASVPFLLSRLHSAAQEGDLSEAESTFNLLCLQSGEHFTVTQETINAMIFAAAQGGNIERAKHWFGRLVDFDLDPDVKIFTSMISAGSEYGNVSFAEEWFEVMGYYQVPPNVATYGALMKAAANAKDLPCAEKWFSKAQAAAFANQNACTVQAKVMKAAAKAGDVERAEWWFEEGRNQTGMALDTTAATTLLLAAKESRNLHKAEAFFADFLKTGLQPNFQMLNCLIAAAASVRQPKKAAKWLDEMKDFGLRPTRSSYASLMNAWFKADNPDGVLEVMEEMSNAGFPSNVVDYTMAIRSVGRAGRPDSAEELARRMLEQRVYPNERTLSALSGAVGNARFRQLERELKLHHYIDKNVDQSRRQITQRSKEAARLTDIMAVKAKNLRSIQAEA